MAKKATKKKTKKKEEKVVEEFRQLSETEMLTLDNHNYKVMAYESQLEQLKRTKSAQILLLEKQMGDKLIELNRARDERKEYNKMLKEELGIASEKWGYDPLTGEVKI